MQFHRASLSSNRMANLLRINAQFFRGAVHFSVMYIVVRNSILRTACPDGKDPLF